MRFLPFVKGMMPVQLLFELAVLFGALTLASYLLQRHGHRLNKLFQAVIAFVVVSLYFRYRLYPPLPFSMFATCLVAAAFGIWGWVSSNDVYWKDFCWPIFAVVDGQTGITRALRMMVVALLPFLVWAWAYSAFLPPDPDTTAPIEIRNHYPAPPAQIIVYSPEDFRR